MSVAMPNVKNFVQRGAGAAGALLRHGWRHIWDVGARRWARNTPRRRFSAQEGQNMGVPHADGGGQDALREHGVTREVEQLELNFFLVWVM